jgi:acetyl esterase/lipase
LTHLVPHAAPLLGWAILALMGLVRGPARAGEPGSGPFEVEKVKDLAYYDGPGSDKIKHRLDLFLPRGQKDFPVLVFVHGGAWLRGDKSFLGIYSKLGSFFARHGIGAVVTNYRLSPAVKHPEHVKDVARAFAWTVRNIARYGGRPDQVFVCGHSAGAHLVALLATDESYLKQEGLTVQAIKGVIPLSGIYRLPEKLLPMVFGDDPAVRRLASPLTHVRAGLPPFLILFADRDYPGCGKQSGEGLCQALKEKGNRARTLEVTESSHFKIILSAALPGNVVSDAILDFIKAHTARP